MPRSLTGRRYDPDEPGFPFVYVNQDGTVRELSPAEREYLSTEFDPTDGGRPYVKATYESRDGWGSVSGYLSRAAVPPGVAIALVHPDYDASVKDLRQDWLDANRAAGDVIVHNPDGTITMSPNPALSREERFDRIRSHRLEAQRRREELGRA